MKLSLNSTHTRRAPHNGACNMLVAHMSRWTIPTNVNKLAIIFVLDPSNCVYVCVWVCRESIQLHMWTLHFIHTKLPAPWHTSGVLGTLGRCDCWPRQLIVVTFGICNRFNYGGYPLWAPKLRSCGKFSLNFCNWLSRWSAVRGGCSWSERGCTKS